MNYIVALGNEFRGDDGIGSGIIHYILEHQLEREFCAIDLATNIWGLLPLLTESTQKILLIDCVYLGKNVGEFQFLSFKNIINRENKTIENHEINLLQLIKLVEKSGSILPPFTVMGIEPEQVKLGHNLSTVLEKKVPYYAQQAIDFLCVP